MKSKNHAGAKSKKRNAILAKAKGGATVIEYGNLGGLFGNLPPGIHFP